MMVEHALYRLWRSEMPLLVNVPHAGTVVPDVIAERLTPAAQALPDTDWFVDRLYDFVPDLGATLMTATHSRYVIDLNRSADGRALYAGASNTELCPTTTFGEAPIYRAGMEPSPAEIAARVREYWLPYHDALRGEIARIRSRHGFCVLLDGHSIVGALPRFFSGRLPDLNLGTADGSSAAPDCEVCAWEVLRTAEGFSAVRNGRFKGGYITRGHGDPSRQVHALQLEMAQSSYLDDEAAPVWNPARAARLIEVLQRLAAALLAWRPARLNY